MTCEPRTSFSYSLSASPFFLDSVATALCFAGGLDLLPIRFSAKKKSKQDRKALAKLKLINHYLDCSFRPWTAPGKVPFRNVNPVFIDQQLKTSFTPIQLLAQGVSTCSLSVVKGIQTDVTASWKLAFNYRFLTRFFFDQALVNLELHSSHLFLAKLRTQAVFLLKASNFHFADSLGWTEPLSAIGRNFCGAFYWKPKFQLFVH